MPSQQSAAYAALPGWQLLVLELGATPQDWLQAFYQDWNATLPPSLTYLNASSQQLLRFATSSEAGDSARRNAGALFAIACGAEIIYEAEEDVMLKDTAVLEHALEAGPFGQALGDPGSGVLNPYALFGHPEIWPPGFPIEAVKNATFEFRRVQYSDQDRLLQPLIQTVLVDGNPDTAAALALAALAHKGSQEFYGEPRAIAVRPGHFAPFGLGGTFFHRDAFWALPLRRWPSARLAPATRSLWAQRLLPAVGGQLLISRASLRRTWPASAAQLREAFLQEDAGNEAMWQLVGFLRGWELDQGSLQDNMLRLARDLSAQGLWPQEEVEHMVAWVADLGAVGYRFPNLAVEAELRRPIEVAAPSPAQATRRKLAAFCVTGQIDRAPDGLASTLERMQRLLVATDGSAEALQLAQELEHEVDDSAGAITFAHDTFAYASTKGSCDDQIRWMAQHPFMYSILYNDPQLAVPYPLDVARFGGNAVVPMLYQMHGLQRCFEMVEEYSRQTNTEYRLMVRLRTDHRMVHMSGNASSFALWREASLAHVTIPQPSWDFSDIFPEIGGYQDRIGWGPVQYMRAYMCRWNQFYTRNLDSRAPLHGESSLKYALQSAGVPVVRLDDSELVYTEVPHRREKCAQQEANRKYG
jgi:hypothetical protein